MAAAIALTALTIVVGSDAEAHWRPPVRLSSNGDSVRSGAQISVTSAGRLAVAWTARTQLVSFSDVQVILGDDGEHFGAVQTLAITPDEFDSDPTIALDPTGNAVATWFNPSFAPGEHVYVGVAPAGLAFLAPPVVLAGPSDNEQAPRVVLLGNGDAVIVWSSHDAFGEPIRAAVRRAGVDFAAAAFSPVALIGARNGALAQLAVDGADNVLAVWRHASAAGALEYSRLSAASGTWSPVSDGANAAAGQVIYRRSTAAFGQGRHALAAAANGAAVVVVPDRLRAGNAVELAAVRFDPADGWVPAVPATAGEPFTPLVVPGSAGVSEHHVSAKAPALAMDAQGNALVVWVHHDGNVHRIKASELSAAGTFGETQILGDAGPDATDLPSIAMDPAGNAVVAWGLPDRQGTRIVAAVRPAGTAGGFCRPEFVSQGGAASPAVAMDAGGNAYAVWDRADGTSALCCKRVELSSNVIDGCPPALPSLANPAAKHAVNCQKGIGGASAKFVKRQLDRLASCADDLASCIQTVPAGAKQTKCLAKARNGCGDALASIDAGQQRLTRTIVDKCDDLVPDDLLGSSGLGYGAVAAMCTEDSHVTLGDAASVAACLDPDLRCRAERLYALQDPRAAALAIANGVTLRPDSCLPDRADGIGGVGSQDVGKAVRACGRAIAKAGRAFVDRKLDGLTTCAEKVFSCVQKKQSDADCLRMARDTCTRELGRIDDEAAQLPATVVKKCGAVPFDTLAAATGLDLGAAAVECATMGVASLTDVGTYASCLLRQHACIAEDLLVRASPRIDELLDVVGHTRASVFCPVP